MVQEMLSQQAQQIPPAEAEMLMAQSADILAQFTAPIFSQLMTEYSQQISAPQDEDPLVAIRKQDIVDTMQVLVLIVIFNPNKHRINDILFFLIKFF